MLLSTPAASSASIGSPTTRRSEPDQPTPDPLLAGRVPPPTRASRSASGADSSSAAASRSAPSISASTAARIGNGPDRPSWDGGADPEDQVGLDQHTHPLGQPGRRVSTNRARLQPGGFDLGRGRPPTQPGTSGKADQDGDRGSSSRAAAAIRATFWVRSARSRNSDSTATTSTPGTDPASEPDQPAGAGAVDHADRQRPTERPGRFPEDEPPRIAAQLIVADPAARRPRRTRLRGGDGAQRPRRPESGRATTPAERQRGVDEQAANNADRGSAGRRV